MSINLNNTINSYNKLLSNFVEDVYIDITISDFEKLELLSNLLNSLRLIQKYVPINLIKLDSITLNSFEINNSSNLLKNDLSNIKDLLIYIDYSDKNYYENIIHSIGEYVYYYILSSSNSTVKKELSIFCEKLLDIFINKYENQLDDLVLINDNEKNLLNALTKGNELFAKAFKNYILYSELENYAENNLEFTQTDFLSYKDTLSSILNKVVHELNIHSNINIENDLNEEEKESILQNELRLKCKYINKDLKDNNEPIDYERDTFNINPSNITIFYEKSIKELEKTFDFEFSFDEDLDNSSYDMDNILSIKEDIKDLSSFEICELEDILEDDIVYLTNELMELENIINMYKTKNINNKKRNKLLEFLIMHMFFLSEEQRVKILAKKSLESADITYDNKHIKYSENHKKRKGAIELIKNEPAKVKVDIYALRKKIAKIYGLELKDIKESTLKSISNSATVKVTLKDKKKRFKKKKNKNIENDNLKEQSGIYDPTEAKNQQETILTSSTELIDAMLKKKLSSVYSNSSSKFKNKYYRRLKVSNKFTGLQISSSKTERLLGRLINDTESIANRKKEQEKEELLLKKEQEKQKSIDDFEL